MDKLNSLPKAFEYTHSGEVVLRGEDNFKMVKKKKDGKVYFEKVMLGSSDYEIVYLKPTDIPRTKSSKKIGDKYSIHLDEINKLLSLGSIEIVEF